MAVLNLGYAKDGMPGAVVLFHIGNHTRHVPEFLGVLFLCPLVGAVRQVLVVVLAFVVVSVKEVFKYITSEAIPFTFEDTRIDWSAWTDEEKEAFRTRDILMVRGTIDGEMFAFFVCHLPSRLGGKGADLRPRGAEIAYTRAMELQEEFPGIKSVVMGDMNDNPTDVSMTEYLHGKEFRDDLDDEDFFNPFLSMIKAGYSSLYYRGAGNIFDIVMVNKALADAEDDTFEIQPILKKKFYGRIFSKPYMTNQSGQYKGTPFRTFSNGAFVNGYSDHYPTYIVIKK